MPGESDTTLVVELTAEQMSRLRQIADDMAGEIGSGGGVTVDEVIGALIDAEFEDRHGGVPKAKTTISFD